LKVSTSPSTSKHTDQEKVLAQLAATCKDVADELLDTHKTLEVLGSTHRTWKSFRQALRTVWKRDKINTFQVDWNIDYIVFVIYVGGDSSLWQVGGGTRRSYSYNLQEL
jgi:hypothetical protein